MANRTETETKVSKVVREALALTISAQPHLESMTEEITLMPLNFGKGTSEVMVVKMPEELLRNARLEYSKMIEALKKVFFNALVLTMNNNVIPEKKNYNPNAVREIALNDILFPAVVAGRSLEVESRDEMRQCVYLDPKKQFWDDSELRTIEKVLGTILDGDYRIGCFGAGQ